jgi:purine-binding chemotaxis protein CheW
VFRLNGQWLATSVRFVREILDDLTVTPLPNAPSDVLGVIDVRGESIPVVELGVHLGVHGGHGEAESRCLVCEIAREGAEPLVFGVRTQAVRDVRVIGDDGIEETPETLGAWDARLLRGVARLDDMLVMVVDLAPLARSSSADDSMFDFG